METEVLTGTVAPAAGSDLAVAAAARPADCNPYHVYLASLPSPRSRRTMAGCLDQVACLFLETPYNPDNAGIGALFPWEELRYRHTAAARAAISEQDWSPSYANNCLGGLRKVLEAAWDLELLSTEDYMRARKVKNLPGKRLPGGRIVSDEELALMLAACSADDGPAAVRDEALLAVLCSTGMRRSEIASVRLADYDPGRRRLTVIGKGNKERAVFLQPNADVRLGRWLRALNSRQGAIFRPVDKWNEIADRPLSPDAVYGIVCKRREQAGLPALTPHDLRHKFIGDLLATGAHLPQAQELAGHASVDTTSNYVRHVEEALREATDRLPIPAPAHTDET